MSVMRRRDFLGGAATAPVAFGQGRRPNILLILADDLGYGNLGCYGQKRILTPNLDRMAAEGTRFTQAYAGSTVCAPSRCALMTGLHTGHGHTRGNMSPDLPLRPSDVTVTEILKNAGYRTGLIGKWSLGGLGSTGYPLRKGFDEWFGFFSQLHAHNYYPDVLLDGEGAREVQANFGSPREYAHDLFAERALRFIAKKDERPFFLKVSFTIPHANNELGRDTGNGMEVPSLEPYAQESWPAPDRAFAAMVTRLDRDVGRIFGALRSSGQDRDTVVFFSSDNGPHREGGHDPEFFDDNGPLRGIKRDLYEGGIRVPMIARWPDRIPAGRVSDHVWAFWDFLPTAAELAQAKSPEGLDGVSIVPALMGKPQEPGREYLYWEFHEGRFAQAVRFGDWKAIRKDRGAALELYNLREDVGEARDVAGANREVAARAEKMLASARTPSPYWPKGTP